MVIRKPKAYVWGVYTEDEYLTLNLKCNIYHIIRFDLR